MIVLFNLRFNLYFDDIKFDFVKEILYNLNIKMGFNK